jgi:hypothetical protein
MKKLNVIDLTGTILLSLTVISLLFLFFFYGNGNYIVSLNIR